MNQKTLHARAETVTEAMESIKKQIPPGWFIRSSTEKKPLDQKTRCTADTLEEALNKARGTMGINAVKKKETIVREPILKKERVTAFTEEEARRKMNGISDEAIRLVGVELIETGKKGLLGMGKKPNMYELQLLYQAIVEIEYRSMAEISADISNDHILINVHFLENSEKGNLNMMKEFLELGADINTRNRNGTSALMLSAFNGHEEVSEFLIEKGIDIGSRDNGGFDALMVASECSKASVNLIKKLLEKGADIHAKSNRGSTALMAAAKIGHPEIVELLVRKGADINARNTDHNITPLIWAANGGHIAIVKYLMAKNADPDIVTDNGYTAVSIARENGHHQVADYILQQKK